MTVALALVPGSCSGVSEWSATAVASSQSALAGVLAGFVFGGIVVLLSVRASHGEQSGRALKLLFCSFFGLTVVAYLFADQAGDKNCLRATSEESISGGILGTFAIIMIISLSWLVVAYDVQFDGVLQFLRHLIYFASAFVVLLLCTSSYSTLQAEIPHGPGTGAVVLIYLAGALVWLVALPKGSQAVDALTVRMLRSPWLVSSKFGAEGSGVSRKKRDPVDRCARMTLAYLAVAAIADAVVLSTPDSLWGQPNIPFAYLLAWLSLLIPLSVLVLALRALAPGDASSRPFGTESGLGWP